MMNIGHTSVGLLRLYSSRAIDEASSMPTATEATRRRLTRSATMPVTSTSIAAGRNSASPIQPRSASRPEMSNASLPTVAACRATPVYSSRLATSRRRTDG